MSTAVCSLDYKKSYPLNGNTRLESIYKNILTCIIFSAPHIGHLYSAVLADTVARFNSMLGHSVYLCTGTDEHGTKVQKAAEAANLPTIEYCNQISHQFLEMCNMFQVKYSDFIRTTEKRHEKAVHHFWVVKLISY